MTNMAASKKSVSKFNAHYAGKPQRLKQPHYRALIEAFDYRTQLKKY